MAITNTKGETLLDQEIIQKQFDEGKLTTEEAGKLLGLVENVLSVKSSELHSRYDLDIKELTGKEKPHGVKTYDHLKSVISGLIVDKGDPAQIQTLQGKIKDLETKLESGVKDDGFKQKATDLQARLDQMTQSQAQTVKEWEDKLKAEKEKNSGILVSFEFQKALASEDVRFKPSEVIPETVRDTYINQAIEKVLQSVKPEFIQDNGKTGLIFRDQSGNVVNDPDNSWTPHTAKSLLLKELAPILDKGKKQGGGGTNGKGGGGSGGVAVDLTGAKTQADAAEIITQKLMAQGLGRGTPDFQKALDKLWTEEIKQLPIQ